MHLVVVKSNLKNCLGALHGAIGENQNLPILKNILIEAVANTITLTATNLEIAVRATLPGKIIEKGRAALPFSVLSQLVQNLSSERIALEEKNTAIEVTTDNYRASIKKTPSDEFPSIPSIEKGGQYIKLKADVFASGVAEVVIAAQASDFRPELSSVLLSFSLDNLKFVATDSFRLAEKTIPSTQLQTTHTEEFGMLIPLKTAQELTRIFKPEESVTITHDRNQVVFLTESVELTSRLTTGTFPNYQPLIPTAFAAHAHLNREELISAVKLGSVFGSTTHEILLRFVAGKQLVEIFSSDQALGDNISLLHTKTVQGEKEGAFNWRYLADGLRAITSDEVFVGINEETKPALVRSVKDTSYLYIVMPIMK